MTGFRQSAAILSLCALLAASGCENRSGYELAPVSGKVTLDGKVVPYTRITFTPQAAAGAINSGPGSTAAVNDDGTFTLKTVRGENGAVVGKHTVIISSKGPPRSTAGDTDVGPPPKEAYPAKFNAQTELTAEVPAGGTTTANFELVSK